MTEKKTNLVQRTLGWVPLDEESETSNMGNLDLDEIYENNDDDYISLVKKPSSRKRKDVTLDDESKIMNKKIKKSKSESEKQKKLKKEQEKADQEKKFKEHYSFGDMNFPMYASTVYGSQIKKTIEILSLLTEEAILIFKPTGLTIIGTDPTNIAIAAANFPAEKLFYSYYSQRDFEIGIEVQSFAKILGRISMFVF